MMRAILLAMLLTQVGLPQQDAGVISGQLLSSDGRPASNVRVALTAAGEDSPIRRVAQTDSSGRYRIEGVLPGQYHILAGPPQRPTYLPGVVTRATASVITLNAGSSVAAAEFRLANSDAAVSLRVKGRVSGAGPAGQTLVVVLDHIGGNIADRRTPVNVEPDGSFEVSELVPGDYEIYLFDRVVGSFALIDKDVTNLVLNRR